MDGWFVIYSMDDGTNPNISGFQCLEHGPLCDIQMTRMTMVEGEWMGKCGENCDSDLY